MRNLDSKCGGIKLLVLDEGHRVKAAKSVLAKLLKEVVSGFLLLLSGTPIQNNVEEIWCLLNVVNPNIFWNRTLFVSWFAGMSKDSTSALVAAFHGILRPFMLRPDRARIRCHRRPVSIPPS